MVLVFTDNEQLNRDLSKQIEDSRIVYYPDYVLEEKEATTLIASVQPNKYNFRDFNLYIYYNLFILFNNFIYE